MNVVPFPITPSMRSIALLSVFLIAGSASAQTFDQKIKKNQTRMEKIRSEIKAYEQKIAATSQKEKGELETLNEINQKVGLLQQLLGELEQGRFLTEGHIAALKRDLRQTQHELGTLRGLTRRRLVQIYKHREEEPLAIVLTAQSWTQAYARLKYLKLIAEQDRRDLQSLRTKKETIEKRKTEIERELVRLNVLIAQKQHEKVRLDQEIRQRKTSLQRIRKDRAQYKILVEQRRDDLATLESLIADLERKKKEAEALAELKRLKEKRAAKATPKYKEPVYTERSEFGSYKGRLPYPVQGRIAVKFGDQIHPVLGTKTRNPGVEIQTVENAPVHAVAKGRVTLISWLRRLGNTVIVDHKGGYYTVYAHLSEIYVGVDEDVKAGDPIGKVDESDDGRHLLHFEIYQNREPQDPSEWLK